jgi:hypothetical protein
VVEGGFEPPKDDVQLIYSQSRLATSLFHQHNRSGEGRELPRVCQVVF